MSTRQIDKLETSFLKCPVCLEHFAELRRLPKCKHGFCEGCIIGHATELIEETGKNKRQCPVCRETYVHPDTHEEIMKWIQTMEITTASIRGDTEQSAESVIKTLTEKVNEKFACKPCKKLGKNTTALFFCVECQERFCKTCNDICHSVNLLSDHNQTFIETVKNEVVKGQVSVNEIELSDIIADYFKCTKHDGKSVGFICKDDNQLCCFTCVLLNHRNCKSVLELGEVALDKKNSKIVSDVEEVISKLSGHCQTIIDNRKTNEDVNKKECEEIADKIHVMRMKVNNLIDRLEEEVKRSCRAMTKTNSIKALDEIEKLQNIMKDLFLSKSIIDKAKYESNMILMYVIIHKTMEKIHEHENTILQMSHDIKEYRFELDVDPEWQCFVDLELNDTSKMAQVCKYKITPQLPRYDGREMLCHSTLEKGSVHKIDIYKTEPKFTSITEIQGNHLLLSDGNYGHCIIVLKDSFERKSCIDLPGRIMPYCATVLQCGDIVISAPAEKKLFIAVWKGKNTTVKCGLDMPFVPKALHGFHNGDLAISWSKPAAFSIISQTWMQTKVFLDHDNAGRVFKSFNFMAIDEKRSCIIQPCEIDKAVYCFDFKGSPRYVYSNPFLKVPGPVALDRDGNVYVCDIQTSSIHVLSVDGKLLHIVRDDCLRNPQAITFMNGGIKLVVVNKHNLWEFHFKASENTQKNNQH